MQPEKAKFSERLPDLLLYQTKGNPLLSGGDHFPMPWGISETLIGAPCGPIQAGFTVLHDK